MEPVISIAVAIVASWLVVEFAPLPFLWVFIGWSALCVATSIRSESTALRIGCNNLAAVLFVFSIAEIVYIIKWEEPRTGPIVQAQQDQWSVRQTGATRYKPSRETYIYEHDYLGYAPLPDNIVIGTSRDGDRIVYEIVYTIDSDGLRHTASRGAGPEADCVLFFGGSYTVGEGVRDDQTMASVVAQKAGPGYRAYNFGFHGYGPHQMLSALQHGIVDDIVECRPRYVFYQAIRAHVKRVSGLSKHDHHGPRYRLRPDGELIYDGHFDDAVSALDGTSDRRTPVYEVLSKSYFFHEMHRVTVIYSEQVELLASVVDASRELVESRWPGSEFHVILWNERFQPKTKKLEWTLEDRGLRLHLISEILPGYLGDKTRFRVTETDHHPNALAHELIGNYIVDEVIRSRR